MLIDKCGNINYEVKGVIVKDNNIMLSDNQFLQWTPTGKRLELWEGKKEYLEDEDPDCNMRRIKYWSESSIYGFLCRLQ